MFFFEKKNQKTFATFGWCEWHGSGFGVDGGNGKAASRPSIESFLGDFFTKKSFLTFLFFEISSSPETDDWLISPCR